MLSNYITIPFKVLYFDLIIIKKAWDNIIYIAYFVDEVIYYNWVFPFINYE